MKFLSIAKYTFISNFRNKIFLVLLIFGFLLLASSILLGLLSQEQEVRMLVDLGLTCIEKLSLLTAVFLMVTLVLEEMDSRTIYLVLTRSISKKGYLFGRFLGTMSSVLACVLLMAAAHLFLILFKGWNLKEEGLLYFLSLFMSFEKVILISSLALFFSLFSSSALVSIAFTFFFWILGHFAMELKFLATSVSSEFSKLIFKGFYFLIPHFQYLNARDLWLTVLDRLPIFIVYGTLYTALYSSFALTLAILVFRKKEF
ncbi:MAG: hypothetical protein A3I11_08940 [Elusimicrobia bacterium RIFCSPLOWO2_02_FULL_39_32]|nr:MAG: hypothetical protein A2034_05825 [Elusimicrobia bacterium GWA2_38_7]OGR80599.1 MAG: hypothetical protein A3B80_06750 [Elusimicrobia bacterium RIFCSPHIGHO2_02_FULL_39_36]OGR91280.1 MAG: hypothetical protein A3I11_08940 [Elusimicrobia bacterium RIFCSPLOWO2_02_FULL_39_32]OGS00654.1 MAG: hypothetical protein A3G85_02830 [Elusimicrobia bacterium RIFCSPLOWO2_12_FULL_39_28]